MSAPLIAVAIATVIATQLLTNQVKDDLYRARVKMGEAQGQQLDRLAQAVNEYSSKNATALSSGVGAVVNVSGTPATVANKYAPTVAELTTMGYLKANFSATNYFGGNYSVTLSLKPTGCSYPNCSIGGLVYLTNAVLSRGLPDITVLGAATQKVGSAMGFSKQATPGTIYGHSGGWNEPNPAGNVAGILAEQVGTFSYDSLYYRLDGAAGLTAAFNAGGQAFNNIKSVAPGTACTGNSFAISDGTNGVAAGAVLSCQGGAYASQSSDFWQSPVASKASLDLITCNASNAWQTKVVKTPSVGSGPRAYTCNGAGGWLPLALDDNGNLTVPGALVANGNVTLGNAAADTVTINGTTTVNSGLTVGNGTAATATNTLVINRTATEGTACPAGTPNGALARDITTPGLILSCQSSSWRKASGTSGFQGIYTVAFNGSCQAANPLTGACSCPAGSAARRGGTFYLNGFWSSQPDNLYACY